MFRINFFIENVLEPYESSLGGNPLDSVLDFGKPLGSKIGFVDEKLLKFDIFLVFRAWCVPLIVPLGVKYCQLTQYLKTDEIPLKIMKFIVN